MGVPQPSVHALGNIVTLEPVGDLVLINQLVAGSEVFGPVSVYHANLHCTGEQAIGRLALFVDSWHHARMLYLCDDCAGMNIAHRAGECAFDCSKFVSHVQLNRLTVTVPVMSVGDVRVMPAGASWLTNACSSCKDEAHVHPLLRNGQHSGDQSTPPTVVHVPSLSMCSAPCLTAIYTAILRITPRSLSSRRRFKCASGGASPRAMDVKACIYPNDEEKKIFATLKKAQLAHNKTASESKQASPVYEPLSRQSL